MTPEITFGKIINAEKPQSCEVEILLQNCDGNRRMFAMRGNDAVDELFKDSITFDTVDLPFVYLFCGSEVTPEKTFKELMNDSQTGKCKLASAELTRKILMDRLRTFYQPSLRPGQNFGGKSYRGKSSRRRHGKSYRGKSYRSKSSRRRR